MTTALARRSPFKAVCLIVDSRRGLLEADAGLIAWSQQAGCPVHVLLTKCDKLSRAELARVLLATRQALAESATLQAFSAVDGTGLDEARRQLDRWLQ